MNDSLRDPKFIANIVGIISGVFFTLFFQWWLKRKSLSYEIVSDIPSFSVQEDIKHRVQVLLDGKPIENAYLVRMRVVNTGRVPIDDKDFVIPFSVSFGENSEILTAEITETLPPDLPAKFTIPEKQRITIEPLVLNWGDAIAIKILVNTFSEPVVTGRVRGITRLKKRWSPNTRFYASWFFLIGVIISWVLAAAPVQIIINKVISDQQLGVLRYVLSLILAFLVILGPPYLLLKAVQKVMKKQR